MVWLGVMLYQAVYVPVSLPVGAACWQRGLAAASTCLYVCSVLITCVIFPRVATYCCRLGKTVGVMERSPKKWQVRAKTTALCHQWPQESIWCVITDIDCLLYRISPHALHINLSELEHYMASIWFEFSRTVEAMLKQLCGSTSSINAGWCLIEQNVCWRTVPPCFVVEVSFLISLDWFSEVRMNIRTTEAFYGGVWQQKHQLCWGFIWKLSEHGCFLFPADLPLPTRNSLFSYSTERIPPRDARFFFFSADTDNR